MVSDAFVARWAERIDDAAQGRRGLRFWSGVVRAIVDEVTPKTTSLLYNPSRRLSLDLLAGNIKIAAALSAAYQRGYEQALGDERFVRSVIAHASLCDECGQESNEPLERVGTDWLCHTCRCMSEAVL